MTSYDLSKTRTVDLRHYWSAQLDFDITPASTSVVAMVLKTPASLGNLGTDIAIAQIGRYPISIQNRLLHL